MAKIIHILFVLFASLLFFSYFYNRHKDNQRDHQRFLKELDEIKRKRLEQDLHLESERNEFLNKLKDNILNIYSNIELKQKTRYVHTPITSKKKRLRKKEAKRKMLYDEICAEHNRK